MRASNTTALVALLMISLAGCSHTPKQPPPQAQAPPLQTGEGKLEAQEKKAETPPPAPLPQPSAQTAPPPLPPPSPKHVKKPHTKTPPAKPAESSPTVAAAANQVASASPPASQPAGTPVPATTQQAQAALPGTASPIGQLTTGDSATGGQTKHETADLIQETQQGLVSIKRPLSTDEQATAAQIRTFLKQAKQALDSGDADGAHTLATKAKLLLDELTKG